MPWTLRSLALVAATSLAMPAVAGEGSSVRVAMQVEREVPRATATGGTEVRTEPVKVASRGDVLLYTLQIVNDGNDPAFQARVEDPIPGGTVLVPGSAGGPGTRVTYSVDGGKTFLTYPAMRTVVGEDGVAREIPVPTADYTHVRWSLTDPLDPGQARTAFFKVRVE